jgi:hypothetical protein
MRVSCVFLGLTLVALRLLIGDTAEGAEDNQNGAAYIYQLQ